MKLNKGDIIISECLPHAQAVEALKGAAATIVSMGLQATHGAKVVKWGKGWAVALVKR